MRTFIVSPHLRDKWKDIQKIFIRRYTEGDYSYLQFDVGCDCNHLRALGRCVKLVENKKIKKGDLIIIMDSDTFPIAKNWLREIWQYAEEYEFGAVQRLENPYFYKEIAHPCFCFWIYGTEITFNWKCCNPYIEGWETRNWKKLHRTNKKNLHRQRFALYGNGNSLLYHHGCGSRNIKRDRFFKDSLSYDAIFWKDPESFIKDLM